MLPPVRDLLTDDAEMVCLIKPQFEAGREKVGKKGVVRDRAVHEEVIRNVLSFAADNGFKVLGLDYSPVKGPEGNIEYLMHIRKSVLLAEENRIAGDDTDKLIHEIVENSHSDLDR